MESTFCGVIISQRLEKSSVKPTDLYLINPGEGPNSNSLTDSASIGQGEKMRNLLGLDKDREIAQQLPSQTNAAHKDCAQTFLWAWAGPLVV